MNKKLSIVIPLYFNETNIPVTYAKLVEEVFPHLREYELILVDDGSKDQSYSEALKLRAFNDKVKVIKLSRNFGQHTAIYAGLEHITGDC
ncbi:MAG: glycosyl transferase 2 family protein, partial [Gammaproteobacteria bacterium]|nr:glycosyl transferase 2 family protein [Gammaproteobacteria bacterium]